MQRLPSPSASEPTLRLLYAEVTRVTTVGPVDGVHSSEAERPIVLCRHPLISLDAAWDRLRDFS